MNISMLCHANTDLQILMETILAAAQAGDQEAFGQIFEHHQRFIYKFTYAMSGEHDLAEELTQETFLIAYKSIGSLRGDAKLQTWLCGIAKNLVYKSFRSSRRKDLQSDDESESLEVCDEKSPLPDEQVLSKELNGFIAAALGKLKADQRLIFILREIQHLSYIEIAEITGSKIPKLKTDLHRAKIEMRGMLRPYLEVQNEL